MRTLVTALLAVVIVGCGGSSKPAASSASASASIASTTTTSAPSTTAAVTGARGLKGIVSLVAGNGSDDGKGVPGPAADVSLGDKVGFAVAVNGDILVTRGTVEVLDISSGQVSVHAELDPAHQATGGIAVAQDGSIFVASPSNVVKIATDGTRTEVLGAGASGLSTSLGPIAVDGGGNLYVADGSRRVTRVAPDGTVTTAAGTGVQAKPDSAEGDGGPATSSPLGAPSALATDAAGNLYIADSSLHRVRRVAPDGTITTIAGGGTTELSVSGTYAPDGTKPTDLKLAVVNGVAVDGKGRVYVADGLNHAIFRFGPTGGIELVIADQQAGSADVGLPANATRATNVGQLAIDAQGNLVYLDARRIRRIAGAGA